MQDMIRYESTPHGDAVYLSMASFDILSAHTDYISDVNILFPYSAFNTQNTVFNNFIYYFTSYKPTTEYSN